MGHKKPFEPEGTCDECKFSKPVKKSHWQHKYHALECKRFPPSGAQSAPGCGPWSADTFVHGSDYCGEWKAE